MKNLFFEKNGYSYATHSGPSGRPRFSKDFKNGVIFFFHSSIKSGTTFHVVVRKSIDKYLEDIYNEIIPISKIDQIFIDSIENTFS